MRFLYQNRIYVIGGIDNTGSTTNTVEYYDGTKWNYAPNMPYSMFKHTAFLFNQNLYIIGGRTIPHITNNYDINHLNNQYKILNYNIDENTWTSLINNSRSEFTSCIQNNDIYLIGGIGSLTNYIDDNNLNIALETINIDNVNITNNSTNYRTLYWNGFSFWSAV